MSMEEKIRIAYHQSATGTRKGDTLGEVEEIKRYIQKSADIVIPNWNDEKILVINEVLSEFGLAKAKHLEFHTNCSDLSRMPAITKALMALDITGCDLVIARGRLGVPGSGSMLVIMDNKGRILTASLSPAHLLHNKEVGEAVRDEITRALEKTGLERRR